MFMKLKNVITILFKSLIGLIFFLILLEIGLQVYAKIYFFHSRKNNIKLSEENNKETILCLGDSFTYGVGANQGFSYPEQLERILNEKKSGSNFKVVNEGIGGNNSSMLLHECEKSISKYDPEIIIVLIGCNNSWNYNKMAYSLNSMGFSTPLTFKLNSVLFHSKVYKFIKLMLLQFNEKEPIIKRKKEILDFERSYRVDCGTEIIMDLKYDDTVADIDVGSKWEYRAIGEYNKGIVACKKAIHINPYDDESYVCLAAIYCDLGEFDMAIGTLIEAMKIQPDNHKIYDELSRTLNDQRKFYPGLGQLIGKEDYLKLQKNIECVYRKDKKMNKKEFDKWFKHNKTKATTLNEFFKIRSELTDKVLEYDLKELVTIARRKKIKIIFSSYPTYIPKPMQKVATDYNVQLVDLTIRFGKLLLNHDSLDFFVDKNIGGHCNDNGYRIMAEEIAAAVLIE